MPKASAAASATAMTALILLCVLIRPRGILLGNTPYAPAINWRSSDGDR